MMEDSCRITIDLMENAFAVTVPDWAGIAQKKKDAKKRAEANKLTDSYCYTGDCTKKYAAKTVEEVQKLVKDAIQKMPAQEYAAAFAEAEADDS